MKTEKNRGVMITYENQFFQKTYVLREISELNTLYTGDKHEKDKKGKKEKKDKK